MSGTLYIVATPIGNLEDLAPRARQTLGSVDLVAAEDTRHTGQLLSHFGIDTPQFALHEHNEQRLAEQLVARLEAGESIALVSDAGTPLVSDPGYRLVKLAHERSITVSPIPGASALTAALSAAGLPTDRFCFEGFLPAKSKARLNALTALQNETRTLVFYESVHRIVDTLADMIEVFGADRAAFVGRELSKLHEQCMKAPIGDLARALARGELAEKGEFVVVVAGASSANTPAVDVDRLLVELSGKLPDGEIAKALARATGAKRNALYQRLLDIAGSRDP